jgi:hypothetical protein
MAATEASRAARLLGHPLVITLFGAVLAALVLPPLTRSWQDRQKELELKRDLASQIAKASTVAVRRGIVAGAPGRKAARNEWLVQRSITNAIVATYFPNLADCWFVYSDSITSFLDLRAKPDKKGQEVESKKGREIESQLEETRDSCGWDEGLPPAETQRLQTLQERLPPLANLKSSAVPGVVSDLGELLLIGKDGIIRRIIAEHARGYAHGVF